ncbi:hypothetical protein EJ110_NYTH48637 [Nymphaea thermarum]|nr:hypothetical protein EJ110_NYTH48637 [Nymphaea thermarum]
MRKMVKDQGIKTKPGWSWIEADGGVHKFVVGDHSHPSSKEIHEKAREIMCRIVHSEQSSGPMFTVDSEEECIENLGNYYHSEMLAIASDSKKFEEPNLSRSCKCKLKDKVAKAQEWKKGGRRREEEEGRREEGGREEEEGKEKKGRGKEGEEGMARREREEGEEEDGKEKRGRGHGEEGRRRGEEPGAWWQGRSHDLV